MGSVFDLLGLRDALLGGRASVRVGFASALRLAATALRLGGLGPPPPPPAEEARVRGRLHSRSRDREAVTHHYDVGNDVYRLLLGPSLSYSCAFFAHRDMSLEEAQEAKHELVSAKPGLEPGMRLLAIGCGFGGMVLHAARHHGVSAVGVTLSPRASRTTSAVGGARPSSLGTPTSTRSRRQGLSTPPRVGSVLLASDPQGARSTHDRYRDRRHRRRRRPHRRARLVLLRSQDGGPGDPP